MIKFYPSSLTYRFFVYLLLMGLPLLVQGQQSSDVSINRSDHQQSITVITTTIWDGIQWSAGLPDPSHHVVINGNYTGLGYECVDLTINPGFSFAPASEVVCKGNLISRSASISGSIILNGATGIQMLEGTVNDLSVDNSSGAQLSGLTKVKGTLALKSGILNTLGKSLVMVSNATGTARLSKVDPAIAGLIGDVTVQRFVPGNKKGWYFLGPAVLGQTQTSWSDNFTILNNSLFLHNEGGTLNNGEQINGWEYPSGMPTANLELGRGYRVFLNQPFFNTGATFDNTGPLKIGNHNFNVSYSPGGYDGGGWNLIANPYACEFDWHSLSKTQIGGQIHFWNKTQYASYSQGAGLGVNGGTRYVPSSQGFFVKSTGAGPALSISEDAKPTSPMNNSFLRVAADLEDVGLITLFGNSNEKDETAIRWMSDATANFDDFYDVDKLPNESVSMYSMTLDGRRTAIQALPFVDGDEINLGYTVKEEGSYTLKIHLGNAMFEGKTWYLRDNEFGSIYTLTQDYLLNFNVQPGSFESTWRYSLIGVNHVTANEKPVHALGVIVFPNPSKGLVTIANALGVKEICLNDITGREIFNMTSCGLNKYQIPTEHLPKGIYQLKIQSTDGFHIEKLVIE